MEGDALGPRAFVRRGEWRTRYAAVRASRAAFTISPSL